MAKYQHGYLLVGDTERGSKTALKIACEILGKDENLLHTHADFSLFEARSLFIADARKIRQQSATKSFFGKGRVFVIKTDVFTREAANALLKTFEEPAGLNYFFLITSSVDNILPTLRSRLTILNFKKDENLPKERFDIVEKFLSAASSKREGIVENFLDEKEKLIDFLNDLEVVLRKRLFKSFSEEIVNNLEELNKQRNFLFQRSSSPKMIIEHLSLVLSKI